LLLLARLEYRGALEGPERRLDARGQEVVEGGLRRRAGRDIAPEIAGLEALRIARLGEELPGPGGFVRVHRRRPVELEGGRDDASGDLREAEALRLVDRR